MDLIHFLQHIFEKEAAPIMNCTPKVRQKTFGVQFIIKVYGAASHLQDRYLQIVEY